MASVFFENRQGDKAIEFCFRHHKKWGKRDRQFFAELIYDCIRWWRLYWAILGKETSPQNLWQVIAVSLWHRAMPLPDFPEFSGLQTGRWADRLAHISEPAIQQSVPDWLYETGHQYLGAQWPTILAGLNRVNQLVLRPNHVVNSRDELVEQLLREGVESKPLHNSPQALQIMGRKNVFVTQAFKEGRFEVQDGASQLVAPYLDVGPGHFVVDACAGAGGKTLHMGDLLKNRGRILALDIHQWKLDQLKLRARRAQLSNIETKLLTSSKVIKRLQGKADRLLLDVPCTGLGVLRRNPDSKWKITEDRLLELQTLQADILQSYAKVVKPGGKMVYATCSVLPIENENQVARFIANNPNWHLCKQQWIYPVSEGYDGFYMAQLELKIT